MKFAKFEVAPDLGLTDVQQAVRLAEWDLSQALELHGTRIQANPEPFPLPGMTLTTASSAGSMVRGLHLDARRLIGVSEWVTATLADAVECVEAEHGEREIDITHIDAAMSHLRDCLAVLAYAVSRLPAEER